MQKPIDSMMPNLSTPAFSKTGAAGDYKSSATDEAPAKGLGNPFSQLLNHVLKNRANAQPPKNQPEAEKNTDKNPEKNTEASPTGQQSQAPETGSSEPALESGLAAPLPTQKPFGAKPGLPLAAGELLANKLTTPASQTELAAASTDATPGLPLALNTEAAQDALSNATKPAESNTKTETDSTASLPGMMPSLPPAELLLSLQQPPALNLAQPNLSSISDNQPSAPATASSAGLIQSIADRTSPIQAKLQSLLSTIPSQLPGAMDLSGKPGKHADPLSALQAVSGQPILPKLQLPQPEQSAQSNIQMLQDAAQANLPTIQLPKSDQSPKAGTVQPSTESPQTPLIQTPLELALASPTQMSTIQLPGAPIVPAPLAIRADSLNASNSVSLPVSQPTEPPSQGWANHGPESPLPVPGAKPGTESVNLTTPAAQAKDIPTLAATFNDIQAQLHAMNGTVESAGLPDKTPTQNLTQAPLIPELMQSPPKPTDVSLNISLGSQSPGNPPIQNSLSNTPANASTATTTPVTAMPSRSSLLETGHTLLHGNSKLGVSGKESDKDDTTGLDGGANATIDGTMTTAGATTDLAAGSILPTPGSHQSSAATATDSVPQFTSTAQQPTEQVADGTVYSVKNGHKELIIRLNPDNLGEVRINLTSHGNQEVSARMIATTQESHDLLKGQMDTLKQRLESQGIQVDRLSVVMAGSAESQAHTGHGHQQSFQQETFKHQQSAQSQQWTNQDQQANQGTFAQMQSQFQQKQGMSQSQAQRQFTGNTQTGGGFSDSPQKPDTPGAGNDNGRISILV